MSTSRYEQHSRYHNQQQSNGGNVSGRGSSSHYNASPNRCLPNASTSTSTADCSGPVLEQIANLLNLAQNLMHGFKEQRSGPERNGSSRRHLRFHANSPYQRMTAEVQRVLQNSNSNSHSQAQANSNLNTSTTQLSAPQFCRCSECSAHKLRSEAVMLRSTGRGAAAVGGSAASSTSANGVVACFANYSQNTNNQNCKNFQCSICLESYLTQRPMATLCGHIFCRLCIMECLNRQGKCPICNRKLNLTNVFRVFF